MAVERAAIVLPNIFNVVGSVIDVGSGVVIGLLTWAVFRNNRFSKLVAIH